MDGWCSQFSSCGVCPVYTAGFAHKGCTEAGIRAFQSWSRGDIERPAANQQKKEKIGCNVDG